jgi:hypothetical protein
MPFARISFQFSEPSGVPRFVMPVSAATGTRGW